MTQPTQQVQDKFEIGHVFNDCHTWDRHLGDYTYRFEDYPGAIFVYRKRDEDENWGEEIHRFFRNADCGHSFFRPVGSAYNPVDPKLARGQISGRFNDCHTWSRELGKRDYCFEARADAILVYHRPKDSPLFCQPYTEAELVHHVVR